MANATSLTAAYALITALCATAGLRSQGPVGEAKGLLKQVEALLQGDANNTDKAPLTMSAVKHRAMSVFAACFTTFPPIKA